jgi:AcrR family transcriptional regulator
VRRRGTESYVRMSEVQRNRIVRAALDELAAVGYDEITAAQIAARAGVSRKTFYEHFEERDGALVAALEEARSPRPLVNGAPPGQEGGDGGDASGPDRNPEMPGFRRTYRTLRVIQAVGELGARGRGASNREVAEHSGTIDSAHTTRVLARLEGLGFIENGVPWPRRGEPNSWGLTAWGEAVWEAVQSAAAEEAEG